MRSILKRQLKNQASRLMQLGDSGLDLRRDAFHRDALRGRDSCKVTWAYAYGAGAVGTVAISFGVVNFALESCVGFRPLQLLNSASHL